MLMSFWAFFLQKILYCERKNLNHPKTLSRIRLFIIESLYHRVPKVSTFKHKFLNIFIQQTKLIHAKSI